MYIFCLVLLNAPTQNLITIQDYLIKRKYNRDCADAWIFHFVA